MANYFCNVAGDFSDQTGADSTGNEYQGPGGLHAATLGIGSATALAFSDVLKVKGAGEISRLVLLDVDVDVTGWGIADAVQNNNDAGGAPGDDWTGLVVEVNHASSSDLVVVELASGLDVSDVNLADGINNTSAGGGGADPVTAGLDAKTAMSWELTNNAGTAAGGRIKVVGVNGSWTEDGTRFSLDGAGQAPAAITVGGPFWWFKNIEMSSCTKGMTNDASTAKNCVLDNCYFHSNTTSDWDQISGFMGFATAYRTRFESASTRGTVVADNTSFIACTFANQTARGLEANDCVAVLGCVFYDSEIALLQASSLLTLVAHSVFHSDGTDTSGISVTIATAALTIFGNRFTNWTNAGAEGVLVTAGSRPPLIHNYFQTNDSDTSGDVELITDDAGADTNLYDQGDSDFGYVGSASDDYNVAAGATLDSVAVELNA